MAKLRPYEPVLAQQVFEARYDKGYRYLDRCGEAMLILEDLLAEQTGRLWMPEEASPKSARLQCPDMEITLVFNAASMVLDRRAIDAPECDFAGIASSALGVLVGRFGLTQMRRFGARRMKIVPAPEDSIEASESLSVQVGPISDWRSDAAENPMKPRAFQVNATFELADKSRGIRLVMKAVTKVGVDIKVDERLRTPPHLLPEKQHEALREQLRRHQRRQHDPEAGILIDIDYYWVGPSKEWKVADFLAQAAQEADRLERDLLEGRLRK